MSKQRKARRNPEPIDPRKAIETVAPLLRSAKAEGHRVALGGGMAMLCHGFIRATQDVDVIASSLPNDLPEGATTLGPLSFGGASMRLNGVDIDWIVRIDGPAEFYDAALQDIAQVAPWIGAPKLPVISAEWMVILKNIAGRSKDEIDLMWLLRSGGVHRDLVLEHARKVLGRRAYLITDDLESKFLQADIMQANDERLG